MAINKYLLNFLYYFKYFFGFGFQPKYPDFMKMKIYLTKMLNYYHGVKVRFL